MLRLWVDFKFVVALQMVQLGRYLCTNIGHNYDGLVSLGFHSDVMCVEEITGATL